MHIQYKEFHAVPHPAFSHSPSLSDERLGYRIQQAISSPHVQKRQFVEVKPSADESPADWQR